MSLYGSFAHLNDRTRKKLSWFSVTCIIWQVFKWEKAASLIENEKEQWLAKLNQKNRKFLNFLEKNRK